MLWYSVSSEKERKKPEAYILLCMVRFSVVSNNNTLPFLPVMHWNCPSSLLIVNASPGLTCTRITLKWREVVLIKATVEQISTSKY